VFDGCYKWLEDPQRWFITWRIPKFIDSRSVIGTSMANDVVIVDSGLRNKGGHNFSYTESVKAALQRRGFRVIVLANKNLNADIARLNGYHPIFSCGAYDYPPGNGFMRDLAYTYAQSIIYRDELQRSLAQAVPDGCRLIFCHTVNDFELIGWSRYLSKDRLPGRLVIVQRQTPGFHSCKRWKLLAHPYWRIRPHYLNAIRNRMGERFVLATDSKLLTDDLAHIYRHHIVTLPVPVGEDIALQDRCDRQPSSCATVRYGVVRDGRVCIGYMGDAREAKGFFLLPELIRRLSPHTRERARFIVQCPNAASGRESQPPRGVTDLMGLAEESSDSVTLIPERLSERDYGCLFSRLDVVLLPYVDIHFGEGTSGIFTEALALAKPVVVPRGTWMAHELKRSGGGVEFQPGDIDDLTAKTRQVLEGYPEYALKAEQFSSEWSRFHSPRNLVEILLYETGLE
jgi:glycosyltransferase involved in cell wall biosynthesis